MPRYVFYLKDGRTSLDAEGTAQRPASGTRFI
jgi:hypothetical protein